MHREPIVTTTAPEPGSAADLAIVIRSGSDHHLIAHNGSVIVMRAPSAPANLPAGIPVRATKPEYVTAVVESIAADVADAVRFFAGEMAL